MHKFSIFVVNMTSISKSDRILVLGSCFATNLGLLLKEKGYCVCINPFGTIFNPESIANSIDRLKSGKPFVQSECVPMGAGAGKICSFSHHTSFARATNEEFLENANSALKESSRYWRECNKVIITFGTAQVWRHCGKTVSNCLKRPGYEFTHEMLSLDEVHTCMRRILTPDKEYVFTVSPIRHMGEGAHVNTISKSTLHLGIQPFLNDKVSYFPAYEILMDELRDFRWYAEDLVHPSAEAAEIICSRFLSCLDAAGSVDR